MYKILFIKETYDSHMVRLISSIKRTQPNAVIDYLSNTSVIPPEQLCLSVNTFINLKKLYPHLNTNNPLFYIIALWLTLHKVSTKEYDIVNIHFPTYHFSFIIHSLKRICKRLMLTPWGSDVYRISGFKIKLISYLYKKSDCICGINNRFQEDIQTFFDIPSSKFVYLSMASETIDYISEHLNLLTTKSAKEKIGLTDNYVITCGYNGNPAQNHASIIKSIAKIKSVLPQKTTLLFPMTYGLSKEYKRFLEGLLESYNIEYKFVTDYLTTEELFNLRMATDVFVHVQKTDANSATIKEYILCNKIVLNGSWLRYDDLIMDGEYAYIPVNSIDDVSEQLLSAIRDNKKPSTTRFHENILKLGYNFWGPKWDNYFSSVKNSRL